MGALEKASVDELVERFAVAASKHRAFLEKGNTRRGNAWADVVLAVYKELRARDARDALLPLLRSDDSAVRMSAAGHGLDFAPEASEPVLETFTDVPGQVGFVARMTLEVWRRGDLRFP